VTKSASCQSSGVLNCLGLKAQDQDSKGKTNTNNKTVMVKTKTKTVKILSRDKTVSSDFPSLPAASNKIFCLFIKVLLTGTVVEMIPVYNSGLTVR